MPRFQGQPREAVDMFCGPNIGSVWPWKSRTVTEALEVCGHRLRGQYLPPDYKQLQEDLDNNPRIQQALATQQALLEGMLQEVQDFCRDHHWMAGIYEFLRAWGPQKLESMRGCPIKNYVMLVSRLSDWQTRVASVPTEVITKGRLLLLSCHEVRGEMESQLASIRKDILEQVQSECRRGSQQLIAELTDFLKAFQSISSDIHAIAWCSQKVSWQALPSQLIQGPAPRSQHLLQDSAELPMRLDALKRLSCSLSWLPGIQGPAIRVMTWCGRNWAVSRETRVRWGSLIPEGPHLVG